MSIFDAFQVNRIKDELQRTRQERDELRERFQRGSQQFTQLKTDLERSEKKQAELKAALDKIGGLEPFRIKSLTAKLEEERVQASNSLDEIKRKVRQEETDLYNDFAAKRLSLTEQTEKLSREILQKQKEIVILDEEALLQSFGFYRPKYNLDNSAQYKAKLDRVRKQQAGLIKCNEAATCSTTWTINNSQKEGERMIKDYVKLIVRSFNNECDACMVKVKFSNLDAIEKRIRKAFEALSKLGERMSIGITNAYLNLKLEELYLCHEYEVKKQEEKEEQRRIREQMREEARVMKEIEEMKQKVEKEERHFQNVLTKLNAQIQNAKTDAEREIFEQEKTSIVEKISECEHIKADIFNREQNTRAGHVYIISNIGSFGENIYKIGVTRRLDPIERVDELGDASVPFNFDVHALIFSDDAPSLETALHKTFAERRLNLVNMRREFFRVTLQEIEEVVRVNFNKPVEFTRLAEAEQFRESEKKRVAEFGGSIFEMSETAMRSG